ncbi:MAG: alpha/beta hydrolase [Ruminococcus sp.]
MPIWGWIIIGIAAFLLISLIGIFISTMKITNRVFKEQLVRTSPDKWGRECSCPENAEHLEMFNIGLRWGEENRAYAKEVSIVNDGLKLYGEYFDFGFDKCVLIEQGRAESLLYDYYFALPYQKAGCNVLVIDTRANGKSEGSFVSVGIYESRDVPVWINYITENFPQNKEFYIHGICIGSAAAILAAAKPDFPKCVKAIVAEGPYHSFYESFRAHLVDMGKPVYPVLWEIWLICKIKCGINIKKDSPINNINKISVPLLVLSGKKDVFSLPEKTETLFAKCSSKKKRLVWFDEGSHSHLRIHAQEKYDNEIIKFISEVSEL